MIYLRSLLFNILFYSSTALFCVALLPGLLLPRKQAMKIVDFWTGTVYFLEKYIAGLDFEIRGLEYLPTDGESYIVAAKHQSAYETMKLHHLFGDPSIVLKKELLRIPLWGWFLKKADVIAIDRSNRDEAMKSITHGALRMKEQKRPIVIFPQGTRVTPESTPKDKPYKGGIVKMAKAAELPIIPLAMNSGVFWRRNSFLLYPGKIVFEFLPPIAPDAANILETIEEKVEAKSNALMREAKTKFPYLEYHTPNMIEPQDRHGI